MERLIIKEFSKYELKKQRDKLLEKGWMMQNRVKIKLQDSKIYYCQTMIRCKE